MSLQLNVPRMMRKDAMRISAKFAKLGIDVRTASIYQAGCAKMIESHNSLSKNFNAVVKKYYHNDICLNNQWKHNENILEKFSIHFDSFKKLIMGSFENILPIFAKVTRKEFNVRLEHATVDKQIEERKQKILLDDDFKHGEQGYIFSVGGSTDSIDGGKPKDISKIQPNDQNKNAIETKKFLSLAEVKEGLQKRQFENIVETLRKSRPQEGDQGKQLTKEQVQQINYALLCRMYELNRPGTIPPHMHDQELPRPTAKKPKVYGPPKHIKKSSRQSSNYRRRPRDVEYNN